jgi:acyl-CoA thioester hydrolase
MILHRTPYRVIYGDTDRMGVAYHANYLRWFEIGRSELFRHLGLTYSEIEARGIFLPVSEVFCKFISSARYDDLIVIEATIDPTVRGGVKFDYRILGPDGDRLLAKGYTKHAFLDAHGKVVRPPGFFTSLLAAVHG